MPSFSEEEIKRIKYITEMYQKHGLDNKTPEAFEVEQNQKSFLLLLKWTTTQPKKPPVKSDYDELFIISRLGDGVYSRYAEDLIRCICEYQRIKGNDPQDSDPYDLFFYEIQEWAKSRLSIAGEGAGNGFLDELQRRINYLLSLRKSELFTDVKFQHTLSDINDILEKVKCEIVLFEENKSAQEILKQLVQRYMRTIQHSIQFIYYIGNGEIDIPKDCTITNLCNPPSTSPLKRIMDSPMGKYLGLLLKAPHFSLLHHDRKENRSAQSEREILLDRSLIKRDLDNMRTFLCNVPLIQINNVADFTLLQNAFFGHPELPNVYIKFLNLLQYIALYTLVFDRLIRLAGAGGDITIYGLLNNQVLSFSQKYIELTEELEVTAKWIFQQADGHSRSLAREERMSKWKSNFHISGELYQLLESDFKKCKSALKELTSKTISADIKNLVNRFEDELVILYTLTNEIRGHSSEALSSLRRIAVNVSERRIVEYKAQAQSSPASAVSLSGPVLSPPGPILPREPLASAQTKMASSIARLGVLPVTLESGQNPTPVLSVQQIGVLPAHLQNESHHTYQLNKGECITAAFQISPDVIVCGSGQGRLCLYAYPEFNMVSQHESAHSSPILYLRSVNPNLFISVSNNGQIRIWQYSPQDKRLVSKSSFDAPGKLLAITDDGSQKLFLSYEKGIIKVLDIIALTCCELTKLTADCYYIRFANKKLYLSRYDGVLQTCVLNEGSLEVKILKKLTLPWSNWAVAGPTTSLSDGAIVISESDVAGTINSYLPGPLVVYKIYWLDLEKEHFIPFKDSGHKNQISFVLTSPDLRFVISGSRECFKIWDARTLELLKEEVPHKKKISTILLLNDSTIFAGCEDGSVCTYTYPLFHAAKINPDLPQPTLSSSSV